MKKKRTDTSPIIHQKILDLGSRITSLRQEKSLSRKKLAYNIGIAKSYLGYIEKGEANPTIETLYLLAMGLDVEVYDLLLNQSDVCTRVL